MNKQFLELSWGGDPLFLMTQTQLDQIKAETNKFYPQDNLIDEITANDLQLDELLISINATLSGAGDHVLYHQLFNPCLNHNELNKRKQLLHWAETYHEERNAAREICFDAEKRYQDQLLLALDSDLSNANRSRNSNFLLMALLASVVIAIFIPSVIILSVILLVAGICRFFSHHRQLSTTIDSVVYTISHVEACHKLAKLEMSECSEFHQKIVEVSEKCNKIHRSLRLDYFNSSNMLSGLMNWLTQGEAKEYDRMTKLLYENRELVKEAILLVGEIDAAIAIASYMIVHPVLKNITLVEGKKAFIDAKAMIHPLIKNPISNDVNLHENHLITGSNATGKSSFLKMIAINALFAQCFGFTYAKSYKASFLRIYTSMALSDSIMDGESYFVAEVKSLKRMLDHLEEFPTLCIIDEVLRGTNTQERIAASCELLKEFAKHNCLCLSATHDVELTYLLEDDYQNDHFQEKIVQGKMVFDYLIHHGRSHSRNAIALLEMMEYDPKIIKQANTRLLNFEKNGEWSIIE